jgi:hypothetical protein
VSAPRNASADATGEKTRETITVRSVLGEERGAELWTDGSFTCPFCGGAVIPGVTNHFGASRPCGNPVCEAGGASAAHVLERKALQAERRARREELERQSAAQQRFAEERQERERREREAVIADGFCSTCFSRSAGRKRIRHRRRDFHTRDDLQHGE